MFVVNYPQTVYAGLSMSLQVEWQYLMLTVLGVREYMITVEEALANKFLLKLLGIQSISGRLRKRLNLGAKKGQGLGYRTNGCGGREPPDFSGVQRTLGGVPCHRRGPINIQT